MADADKSLKLTIETAANTGPLKSVTTDLAGLSAAQAQTVSQSAMMGRAMDDLAALVNKKDTFLTQSTTKTVEMGKATADVGPKAQTTGRAVLELSRGLEDLQYGVGGVINNIPQLTMALGVGAGLTGIISIAVVAVAQLAKHIDFTKDGMGDLAREAGKATGELALTAEETSKAAEAQAKAAATTEKLKDQLSLEDAVMKAALENLKANGEATRDLETRKKALMTAEQNLALARVAADSSLTEVERIRKTADIKMDYSEKANQAEQAALARAQKQAQEEAKLHEENQKRMAERAAAAAAAEQAVKSLEEKHRAALAAMAEGSRGIQRGVNATGGLADAYREKPLTEGLDPKASPLDQARVAGANLGQYRDQLKADLETLRGLVGYQGATDPLEIKYKGRIEEIEAVMAGLTEATAKLAQGNVADRDYKNQKTVTEATAKGLGSPEQAKAKADLEAMAAAQARNKASALGDEMTDRAKINELNRGTVEATTQRDVQKAQEQEEQKKRQEEQRAQRKSEKEARDLMQLQQGARELASLLPAGAPARGALASAANGTMDQLVTLIETLVQRMEQKEKAGPVDTKLAAKVNQLEGRINAMRRND